MPGAAPRAAAPGIGSINRRSRRSADCRPGGAGDLSRALADLGGLREVVEAGEVRVMKSTLLPSGAVHEVLETAPLGGDITPDRR